MRWAAGWSYYCPLCWVEVSFGVVVVLWWGCGGELFVCSGWFTAGWPCYCPWSWFGKVVVAVVVLRCVGVGVVVGWGKSVVMLEWVLCSFFV